MATQLNAYLLTGTPLLFALASLLLKKNTAAVLVTGTTCSLIVSLFLLFTPQSTVPRTDAAAITAAYLISWIASLLDAVRGCRGRLRNGLYGFFVFTMLACAAAMILTSDPLQLFFLVEALIGVSVALIAHSPRKDAPEVAFRYMVITTLSAFLVLIGTVILAEGRSELTAVAIACLIAGLGADIGFFPFHAWVPDAFPASTLPVNVLMCAEHIPLFIALLRLLQMAGGAYADLITAVLLFLGLAAVPFGYVMSYAQKDVLRALAYYVVSEYGFLLASIAAIVARTGEYSTMSMYLLNSAVMEAGLLAALELASTENWKRASTRARKIAAFSYAICALSSLGFPPLSGFYAKLLLFSSLYSLLAAISGHASATIAVTVLLALSTIPLAVLVRILHRVFMERLGEEGETSIEAFIIAVAAATAAAVAISVGVWPAALLLD